MTNRTRVCAYGIIKDNEDRILLSRLSHIVTDAVGKWMLPGGGIDFGEDPRDAVVREAFEETNVVVSCGDLLDVESRVAKMDEDTVHSVRIIYSGNLVSQTELRVNDVGGSTDDCRWFTKEQALALPVVALTEKAFKFLGWQES